MCGMIAEIVFLVIAIAAGIGFRVHNWRLDRKWRKGEIEIWH